MRLRLLAALATLAFAGSCQSSSSTSKEPGTKGTAPPSGGSEGAKKGGYIVMPSGEPSLVNPVLQTTFDLATPLIFEGLVGVDAKFEPQPLLAESWERANDGKTLVFHLRKNVTWHDGKPFTSEDVAFTIESIRKATDSNFSGYFATVDKVETPDPYTVSVTYQTPYGPDLASFIVGVIPKHKYDGELAKSPTNRSPIGTGPYKFTRWEPHKNMILDANPKYWGGVANIDQIELVFPDVIRPKDYLKALRDRKIDFAQILEQQDWMGPLKTPEFLEKVETGTLDETVIMLIAWNNQRKPFDDKRVRVAMTHAIDRPHIIEDVLGGSARPISGPFYPVLWGGDPSVAPWPYDPEKAKQLLDQAGLAKKGSATRFSVELLVQDVWQKTASFDELLATMRTDLEKVGVELKIHYMPQNEVVNRLRLHDYEAVLFQWSPDVPDPDPWALLHSSEINAGLGYAGYVNPEVDKLLEAGRRSNDRAKRKEAYYALHKIVHEDEPYSFLYAPQSHYAWSRRVHGVSVLDVAALPRQPGVARWWVDH